MLDAIGGIFGLARQRDAEKNSPQMQANAAAQTREKIAEQAEKDVNSPDLDQLRKDASES